MSFRFLIGSLLLEEISHNIHKYYCEKEKYEHVAQLAYCYIVAVVWPQQNKSQLYIAGISGIKDPARG